jgi:hypothetical protein
VFDGVLSGLWIVVWLTACQWLLGGRVRMVPCFVVCQLIWMGVEEKVNVGGGVVLYMLLACALVLSQGIVATYDAC